MPGSGTRSTNSIRRTTARWLPMQPIFSSAGSAARQAPWAPTSAPGQELPQSQFAVEVLQLIKGQAAGVVTVNQIGGLDQQARQIMLLEGDAPRAPRGQRAVPDRVRPELGWYQIVAADTAIYPRTTPRSVRRWSIGSRRRPTMRSISYRFNGAVYLSTAYFAEDMPPAPVSHLASKIWDPRSGRW